MRQTAFKFLASFLVMVFMTMPASATSVFVSSMTLISAKYLSQPDQNETVRARNKRYSAQEKYCLALGLYHEARGEPVIGQYAVAATILNRVRSRAYPNSICGVVFQNAHRKHACQFSFACDDISDQPRNQKTFKRIHLISGSILQNGIKQETKALGKNFLANMHDITHYHRYDIDPVWSRKLTRISELGAHVFFKSERVTRRYAY